MVFIKVLWYYLAYDSICECFWTALSSSCGPAAVAELIGCIWEKQSEGGGEWISGHRRWKDHCPRGLEFLLYPVQGPKVSSQTKEMHILNNLSNELMFHFVWATVMTSPWSNWRVPSLQVTLSLLLVCLLMDMFCPTMLPAMSLVGDVSTVSDVDGYGWSCAVN